MASFLSDQDFDRYRNLIYDESGIHFSTSNRTILESRLKERLRKIELGSVADYFEKIRKDADELKVLLDSVTTNLTRFFRNTSHFDTLEHYVIPDLAKEKRASGDKTIRIWSAGCSTGEEPYSLAMAFDRFLPSDVSLEITASDLSLKSLMTAKEGFYPDSRVNGIADVYLNKYFDKVDGGYRVVDRIREKITFDYHNLKFDSGLRNLDVVFCRNVIIYFDEAAQKNVIEKFWNAMNSHSYLFIGHSESLFGMDTKFEFLKTDWACIYRQFA
jgi:chemotaxis protein methyltransferase CheR